MSPAASESIVIKIEEDDISRMKYNNKSIGNYI